MKRERVRATGLALVLLLALAAALGPMSSRAADRHRPLADFDDDGYEDLAVGVPYSDLVLPEETLWDVGMLWAFYGTAPDGLSESRFESYSQCPSVSADPCEANDHFGWALALGDFDGDGYTDVAVGVPGQTVGGDEDAGAVHVFYGEPGYLSYDRDEVWHQDTGAVGSSAEAGDRFGLTLAAGDFDGDGRDDLAVGVPYEDWNQDDAGIVQVLYGSAGGLSDEGHQLWRQGADGIPDGEELGDRFGETLATADFNIDGYADLAVGVPGENLEDPPSTKHDAGVVHVLYGSVFGLTHTDNDLFDEDFPALGFEAEANDQFGRALTTGDFDGNGNPDLAVGVPGQQVGTADGAGAVHILLYSRKGPNAVVLDQVLDRDDLDPDSAEDGDGFGRTLTAADFDGDGRADLAVGAPGLDRKAAKDAGFVFVLYGDTYGPSATRNQSIYQGLSYEDESEEYDQYGEVLAAGDFDRDGYADLAVGVPHEDVYGGTAGTLSDAGAVHVVYGSHSGLTAARDQFWSFSPRAGNQFGYSLAAIPSVGPRMIHMPLVLRSAR